MPGGESFNARNESPRKISDGRLFYLRLIQDGALRHPGRPGARGGQAFQIQAALIA